MMMRLIQVLIAAALLLAAAAGSAESLDDFRDAVARPVRRAEGPPHNAVVQPGPASVGTYEPAWWAFVFIGHVPPAGFSFGDGVYADRGMSARAGDLSFMSVAEPARAPRPGHLQLRLEGLISPNRSEPEVRYGHPDTPLGAGGFLKVETTHTPGFVVWHQRVMDFAASDRLGITHVAIDPRLYTGARGQVFWTVGVPILGSENGLVNAGALVGFGFDAAPRRPFVLHARANASLLSARAIGDVYVDAGLEVVPGFQIVAGYRGLLSTASLHLFTVGLMLDRGIGR